MRLLILSLILAGSCAGAAVVGTSSPPPSLSAARLDSAPAELRGRWTAYLARSEAQMHADRAALAAEQPAGAPRPPQPPEGKGAATMPLNRDAAWYASPAARHVADVIVSFQTPAGGWSKNEPRDGAVRLPGQNYAANDLSRFPSPGDFDAPHDVRWNYVGTIDNDATTTELRFLARVAAQLPGAEGDRYRASFMSGVGYLLAAQFPNGGWPQVWPLQGGYHDAITFNDDAFVHAAEMVGTIARGAGDYGFVPAALRARAAAAEARAIDCILKTQIVVDGRRAIWGQQHDALTLKPVAARNFEPAAFSSTESANLLLFLMAQPHPSPAIVAAVKDGVAWLGKAALHDRAWINGADGHRLIDAPGARPLWARYYDIATGRPIFGDRDKTIHDNVDDLTSERRNGYAWYNGAPEKAIDAFAKWRPQR
jgi:PelA/Pel-15E family pectate lyase